MSRMAKNPIKLKRDRDRLRAHRDGEAEKLGMGPVSFDNSMARRHGWTSAEISRFWDRITTAYKRISRKMHKRYPERYDLSDPKVPIYIGPDKDGHTLKLGRP
jgi:hypothetical protein